MTQPQPPSDLERFAWRISEALTAAESGETHVQGEPVMDILTKSKGHLEKLLRDPDTLVQVTAQEQLRRINAVLMGIAA